MMMREQPSSANLIFCSYDKERRSSAAVDELTSSKWTVLLRRVGDALMVYLLKYTSIFVPLLGKKHHQISGCSIGDLCYKFSGGMPKSRSQHHPLAFRGYEIKTKRVEGDELPRKQLCTYALGSEPSSNSTSFATRIGSTYVSEELPREQSEGNSKQNTVTSQNRTWPYRLQLQRKRRQLAVRGMPDLMPSLIPCRGNSCTSDNLSLFSSSRTFPIAFAVPCSHSKNGCPTNSTCLYHSLPKLLKNLIRDVSLLEKHCFIRSSYQGASRGAGTGPEVANAKNCLKSRIVSFVWAICRRIVPSPLLGEPSNWRILRRNISKFIQLQRFEKFSLKDCIHKLKISKFPIFSNKHTGFSGLL